MSTPSQPSTIIARLFERAVTCDDGRWFAPEQWRVADSEATVLLVRHGAVGDMDAADLYNAVSRVAEVSAAAADTQEAERRLDALQATEAAADQYAPQILGAYLLGLAMGLRVQSVFGGAR
jgi:hypothetical protein